MVNKQTQKKIKMEYKTLKVFHEKNIVEILLCEETGRIPKNCAVKNTWWENR